MTDHLLLNRSIRRQRWRDRSSRHRNGRACSCRHIDACLEIICLLLLPLETQHSCSLLAKAKDKKTKKINKNQTETRKGKSSVSLPDQAFIGTKTPIISSATFHGWTVRMAFVEKLLGDDLASTMRLTPQMLMDLSAGTKELSPQHLHLPPRLRRRRSLPSSPRLLPLDYSHGAISLLSFTCSCFTDPILDPILISIRHSRMIAKPC